jgi:hypothetical protein
MTCSAAPTTPEERSEMSQWIDVKESLPPLDQLVLISVPSFDRKGLVYYWGARVDGDEGWCWAVKDGFGPVYPTRNAGWHDVVTDDDYEVTHWQPMPLPPAATS